MFSYIRNSDINKGKQMIYLIFSYVYEQAFFPLC